MWLILALVGHVANALVAISDKASVEKRIFSPAALAVISGASNIFFFILFPWFLRPAPPDVIIAAILSGASFVAAVFFYFSALGRDEASRVVPAIGGTVPLFTLLLSMVLLGEVLTGRSLIAFLLLMSGGIMIEFHSLASFFSRRELPLFSSEAATAVFFALYSVLLKYAFLSTDPFSAFLWSRVGFVAASVLFLFGWPVVKEFSLHRLGGTMSQNGFWFFGSRILGGITPLILAGAIALGSATLVNALQGAQYGFLFILAILFSRRWPKIFGEEIRRGVMLQKGFATFVIILGLALLV